MSREMRYVPPRPPCLPESQGRGRAGRPATGLPGTNVIGERGGGRRRADDDQLQIRVAICVATCRRATQHHRHDSGITRVERNDLPCELAPQDGSWRDAHTETRAREDRRSRSSSAAAASERNVPDLGSTHVSEPRACNRLQPARLSVARVFASPDRLRTTRRILKRQPDTNARPPTAAARCSSRHSSATQWRGELCDGVEQLVSDGCLERPLGRCGHCRSLRLGTAAATTRDFAATADLTPFTEKEENPD